MKTSRFWSREFVVDTIDRSLMTFAQTFIAMATAALTSSVELSWQSLVLVPIFAAVISVMTSIASHQRTPEEQDEIESIVDTVTRNSSLPQGSGKRRYIQKDEEEYRDGHY